MMIRFLLGAAVFVVLVLSGCSKPWGNATDVQLTMFDGSQRQLSSYGGKPIVVNFWAEWCGPCVAELPHFQEVYSERPGQFELVVINVPMGRENPQAFFEKNGYTFTGVLDDGKAAEAYGVGGIPHTVFIDRRGNKVDEVVGGMDKAEFEAKLASIL
jgi:thiol-disulfide isomerase/thioredoxin